MTTVYAPSRTEDFIRCPVFADLRRRWELRGPWTPFKLLGTSIGEGMAQFYRNLRDSTTTAPSERALETLHAGFEPQEAWTLPGLEKHVVKGLQAAVATTPVRGTVIFVDESLGSGARPDLVFRDPSLGLVVLDTKVQFKGNPRYREKNLAEYETWWQGFHYAWEVGEFLGETVAYVGPHLIQLTPSVRADWHPITITPARIQFWLRQAMSVWHHMTPPYCADPPVPNWLSCQTRYGRCEFFDLCHVLDGDDSRAETLYKRKEIDK